eukprot:TRINITY_DN8531_c0_g2_i1.p1 TRINITY_DN8531_c0_g2~~TRINITY_DN8531_c0_g2_i1.p1  ORF type:complete len:759 (+),score=292.12 TRINITY_DN8531_c0_g2_i1:33-2309(+)
MAFRLNATAAQGGQTSSQARSGGNSFLGSLKSKATAAAVAAAGAAGAASAAANNAANSAYKSARKGVEAAAEKVESAAGTFAPSASSAATGKAFDPPPRGIDEDLARAIAASMETASKDKARAAEEVSRGGPAEKSPAEAADFVAGVQQLEAMGFEKDLAEVALVQAAGDVVAASSLLCGEAPPRDRPAAPQASLVPSSIRAGDRVQIVGLTSASGAALNGSIGRVVDRHQEVFSNGRVLIEVNGQPKMIKVENLQKVSAQQASSGSSMQAQAKATFMDVKRRAEALFGRSQSSSSEVQAVQSAGGARGRTPADRQAALQAAERRLAEARARNAGTMDDWRRYRAEQAQRERAQRKAVPAPSQSEQPGGAQPLSATAAAAVEVEADEEEDLQRALAASMAEAPGKEAEVTASQGDRSTLSAPDVEGAAAVERAPEEEDPELFELRLQEAMAEEELELQLALAASLEAERAALEEEVLSPSAAGAAGAIGEEEEQAAEREQLVAEAMAKQDASFDSPQKQRLEESRQREEQLRHEQEATQARLAELRGAVAQHVAAEQAEEAADLCEDLSPDSNSGTARRKYDSEEEEKEQETEVEEVREDKDLREKEEKEKEEKEEKLADVKQREEDSIEKKEETKAAKKEEEQRETKNEESKEDKKEEKDSERAEDEQEEKKEMMMEDKKDEEGDEAKIEDVTVHEQEVVKEDVDETKEEDLEEKEIELKKEKVAGQKEEEKEDKEEEEKEEKAEHATSPSALTEVR